MAQITTDQLAMLREGHYEGAAYLIAGPQNVVFAARVNGTPIATNRAQINYDTVTTGAYTDLIVDMDLRISHTNDVRKSYFLGRVRKAPTSTILYIDENDANILDNDFIFVVNNFRMVKRQRYKDKVDWDRPYEPLPPIESNVDSAYVVCTSAAIAEFSLSSIGQAIEKGETIASVEWIFTNATVTGGGLDEADVTIEVETPYNAWAHEILTDTNGTTNVLHFTITAGDPNNLAHTFFRLCHEDVPLSSDWKNGFSATATFREGISDLLNDTRITLVSDETFDGDALGVGNVQFVGYLNASSSSTSGDETHGQRKDAQLTFDGFVQLAGKVRFNQIAIRHSAAPTEWDRINKPTHPRNIVHEFAHHSTFLNLVSLDLDDPDETYLTGNANIDETSITDAARKAVSEINGYLVQSAAGKVTLVRNPSAGSDAYRATIPDKTPMPIDLGDVKSYQLPTESLEIVGWMELGFMVIHPTTLVRTFITANAPASGPGNGQEDRVETSQLLASTADLNAALAEARQRTADLYEMSNHPEELTVNFGSGWGSVVRATPGEYYQFTVDADDDTRGDGIDPTENWVCVSVNMTINRSGTQDTIGKFSRVTQGGNAQISVAISPSVINTPIPVNPVISPYPAIPMAPSINYPTTNPTNKIPRDPFSGMQTLPIPTEQAAEAAQNQPNPGESRAYTHFDYDGDVEMGFDTVLNAPYTLIVSGSGGIQNADTACSDEDKITVGTVTDHTGNVFTIDADFTGVLYRVTWGLNVDGADCCDVDFLVASGSVTSGTVIDCEGNSISFAPSLGEIRYLNADSLTPFTLELTITGGSSGSEYTLYADAFYQGVKDPDNPGKWIDVALLSGKGLYIDGMAKGGTMPPYNDNHEYTVSLGDFNGTPGGTGNPIEFRFQDDDYIGNERLPLNLTAIGQGAGS